MKNKILIIILFLALSINAQEFSTQTNTSESSDEVISTENNITRINLFNIDYNDQKIPINLIYSHKGIKVNQSPTSVGYGWQIEDLGIISNIVNHKRDSKADGWFNTLNPDFNYFEQISSCQSSCPENIGELDIDDMYPDFYSLSINSGLQFDFLYKKNINGNVIGLPEPKILQTTNSCKILTNFANFISDPNLSNNYGVFNIIDDQCNNFSFINGPVQQDLYRSHSNDFRNNFYLSNISNCSNSDYVNIEYNEKESSKVDTYYVGFNSYSNSTSPTTPNNSDYTNDVIRNVKSDYFLIDETGFDIKKIISNEMRLEFIYTNDNDYLSEIEIYDKNDNFITGYKFEYNSFAQGLQLWRILKFNSSKTDSIVHYEFSYFDDLPGEGDFINNEGQFEDYFGFNNGVFKTNFLPLKIRNSSGTIIEKGDFNPNLIYAKQGMLKKIINIYQGSTEFEYKLNQENHNYFGNIYGGGLLIQSKKISPIQGKSKQIYYDHEELTGFSLLASSIPHHYIKTTPSKKYTSAVFTLEDLNSFYGSSSLLDIHKAGNFFHKITEYFIDSESNITEYYIVREYNQDFEGIHRKPIIKKETYFNKNSQIIKEKVFNYEYIEIDSIQAATLYSNVRSAGNVRHWYVKKSPKTININRVRLNEIIEKNYQDSNFITESINYQYTNNDNNLLQSINKQSSKGESLITKYYYPNNPLLASEPYMADLTTKNLIATPVLIEEYRNAEKLSAEKLVYKNWGNNLIATELIQSSKGTNSIENNFKYNLLDNTTGNPLEVQQENGIKVCYIWGYNKKHIIAKIENANYSSISSSTITNLQNLSDTGTEINLINALNALRVSLPNSMITTYTYRPLVGISTVIDSKGNKQAYHYDEFNRLQFVKDAQGNIIAEKEYNYKN